MKKALLFILPFALLACGGSEDEKKGAVLDLSEFGLEATIEAGETKEVKAIDLSTNYEQKLFKKSISIEYADGLLISVQEAPKNETQKKIDFAGNFDNKILESGDNYFLIENVTLKDKVVYDCSYYFEKDGAVIEIRIADYKDYFSCTSEEQARKGLEIAKTFKFK